MTDASTSPHEEMTMAVQSTIADIQSAGATAQQQAASAATGSTTLGKDEFLKLLTAQLQQQDPTQPMDSTAFVAQLAQFSSLEQMNNVNDTLTKMLTSQGTALQTTAADMVGKTAIFNTDQVSLTQGQPAMITTNLSQAAANVNLVIQDGGGNNVRVAALGAMQSGINRIQWDGLDDSGTQLPTGNYTAQILATDINGKSIALTQNGSARITGITFDNGTPKFLAGGSTLQLSDISELDE
jgi:flagellar basal-body rod modification protein FlgD